MKTTLVLALLICACSNDFSPPSRLDRLRVLAVRSEPASGSPGAEVTLDLLKVDEDSEPSIAEERPIQVAWLGGCHNPPGRQFYSCFPLLQLVARHLDQAVVTTDNPAFPPGVFGTGDRFTFTVPDSILSQAPRIATDPVHFGVSYVFFAACAGELRPAPEWDDRVPLTCVNPETGEPVGSRDFETGFTTVYTYEGVVNQSPVLHGVSLDGVALQRSACASDADCVSLELPASRSFEYACTLEGLCAPAVQRCGPSQSCPILRLTPQIDPSSVERLGVDYEISWVNYYSTAGAFDTDSQLVVDRVTGTTRDPSGRWHPPRRPIDRARMWVTLHDQRGGTAWTSVDVVVRQ